MEKQTTYSDFDLEKGKCKCCGEQSNEIVIDEGLCVDCIQMNEIYEQTMRGL